MTGAWKESFSPEEVLAVLQGDAYLKLSSAFVWGDTPEGHDYWSDMAKSGSLPVHARLRLHAMLDEYEGDFDQEVPERSEPPAAHAIADAFDDVALALRQRTLGLPYKTNLAIREVASALETVARRLVDAEEKE